MTPSRIYRFRGRGRLLVLVAAGLMASVACPGPQPTGGMDPGPGPEGPACSRAAEQAAEVAPEEATNAPAMAERAAASGPGEAAAEEHPPEPVAEVRPDAPATLTVRLPGPVRRQVGRLGSATAAAPEPLRLTVDLPASDRPVALRAFVNLPGADAATPLDSPHYAGTFPLPGADVPGLGGGDRSGDGHGDAGGSFLVDLARVLAGLPPEARMTEDGSVRLTLVVVPVRAGDELPDGLSRPIGGLCLARGEPGPAADP